MSDGPRITDHHLVGRGPELATITAAMERAAAERTGAALFVSGVPGVGKSRLLRETTLTAGASGWRIVHARCSQDRSALQPLQEATFDLTRDADLLDDPRLASFMPILDSLTRPHSTAAHELSVLVLGEALLRALTVVSHPRPVLLAVEDLHWADPETVSVVEYLVDHALRAAIVLLVTLRSEPSAGADMMNRVVARRAGEVLELAPLPAPDMRDLASACLDGAPISDAMQQSLYDRTEGIPLLVEEVLAVAIAEGVVRQTAVGWEVGGALDEILPGTVANLVLTRADALGVEVRRVLEAAALLGRTFRVDLLGAMTQLPPGAVTRLLRVAAQATFVEPAGRGHLRFRHALMRDAFDRELLGPDRSRLARRGLAAMSSAAGFDDVVTAARLAQDAGDDVLAAQLLCRAGREELARGGLRSAEETLRRGLAVLGDDAGQRADLDEALLDVLCAAGKTEEARSVGGALLVTLNGLAAGSARIADVHLTLARSAITAGRLSEAADHARAAQRLAPQGLRAAQADIQLAEAALAEGDTIGAQRLADAAAETADTAGDPELLCAALDVGGRATRSTDLEGGRVLFERLLSIATVEGLTLWRARALMHLGALDMLTDGRLDRLAEASAVADRAGAMGTAAEIEVQTVLILATQFRMAEALTVAKRATERAERFQLAVLPLTLVCQGGCHAWLGQRDAMERLVSQALELAGDDPTIAALCWGDLRGMGAIFDDEADRGLKAIETAMSYPPRPLTGPAPFRGMWALLRAVADDESDWAREVVRETAAHESWWVLAWLRYADAVALGRHGRCADAEACAAVADDMIDRHVSAGWAKHLAKRHVAEAALTSGWGDPVTWLKEAATFFDPTHPKIAASCRALLRRERVPLPRRGPGATAVPEALASLGVTSREMDVLSLIMEGLSNRDIAARLYLSHRTVEKHVQSLLQRAGVDSRTQLAVRAAKLTAAQ